MFILTHADIFLPDRDKYQSTMRVNQDNGILNWTKITQIENYSGSSDGFLYVFQKPKIELKLVDD